MSKLTLHLRMYSCDKCLRPTALWIPLPAPEHVTLKGGGCEKCSTPAPNFTRREGA